MHRLGKSFRHFAQATVEHHQQEPVDLRVRYAELTECTWPDEDHLGIAQASDRGISNRTLVDQRLLAHDAAGIDDVKADRGAFDRGGLHKESPGLNEVHPIVRVTFAEYDLAALVGAPNTVFHRRINKMRITFRHPLPPEHGGTVARILCRRGTKFPNPTDRSPTKQRLGTSGRRYWSAMGANPRLICPTIEADLEAGFARIREELDVPPSFSAEVLAQAETAATRGPQLPPGAGGTTIVDLTDIEFVAIDPPGARDLDQAYAAERRGDGYRVFYAIADLASFITPGSALDDEARHRGVTLYSPDMRTSLHPESINEDAGSLLAGQDRQALVWTIDLDSDGLLTAAHIERATVRNRRAMSYRVAQDEIDAGTATPSVALLRDIGLLREEQERARGAVSLQLPSQEITRHGDHYDLHFDESIPVEGWNAQISLMTGIAAAGIMIDAGVGLLRTLPTPDDETVNRIRRAARALNVDWPRDMSYADRVRDLTPDRPNEAALLTVAARGLRGAGYVAFHNGDIPEHPEHSAIASTYSHVTAPLRRVCDRFANEILLAACADREPPEWAVAALDDLPEIMGQARRRDRSLERSMVDFVEAIWLKDRVGETFDAVVTGRGRNNSMLMVADPAVIASIDDRSLEPGAEIRVRLVSADPDQRRLKFELAD